MSHDIEPGAYSDEAGLHLPNWVPGYALHVDAASDGVTISGNAGGLHSLAQHLLTLAAESVPPGPRPLGTRA